MSVTTSDYHRGDMNIDEQKATFAWVMGMTKWGSLTLAVGLVFAILWFCTAAGVGAAFTSALILAVIGVFALRKKPSTH
jgi:hypothetical protein